MTIARYRRILEVLGNRQPDLAVLAEAVYKPHNLSAILRSCDAVGIGLVHAVDPTGGVPTFQATSASAEKWVSVKVHQNLEDASKLLRDKGMQLLAAHLSVEAVDYRSIDYRQPTCIIVGNERHGVSKQAAELADEHIIIPMLGMVRSLNVSVAAAIILFEAQRQRWEAGHYRHPRLEPEDIHKQAFAWLHPQEAQRLAAAGQPFPPLAEDGSIQGG